MEAYGFTLDPPEAPLKLQGAPEYESVELTLTLHTTLPAVRTGTLTLSLPIAVKNGAPLLLTLKAHVVVPDVALSTDSVAFEEVLAGQCKVCCVVIRNTRQVPAEWCVKRPVENTKAKDWSYF